MKIKIRSFLRDFSHVDRHTLLNKYENCSEKFSSFATIREITLSRSIAFNVGVLVRAAF